MGRFFGSVWISVFLLLPLFSIASSFKNQDRILVISSYSPLKESGNRLISSFWKQFENQTGKYVSVEYMDSETNAEFETWEHWLLSLFNAYGEPPCAVVIIGNEAWSVYRKNCTEAWKNVPVILGGVKKGYIDCFTAEGDSIDNFDQIIPMEQTFGDLKVTGYYIVDYIAENFKFIKKLQPEITDIYWCYDDRYKYYFFGDYLKDVISETDIEFRLHYFSGNEYSTYALLDSVRETDDKAAWITVGWYTDANKYIHAYTMLHNELTHYADKFMYEIQEQDFMNPNYLGGYFVLGSEIGSDLAGLVAEVVKKGFENSPSFQITPSAPAYHINYETFVKAGLSKANLPSDVVWHNVELSLFKRYPAEVTFMVMLLVLMISVSVFVFIYRRRRMSAYEEANEKMSQLLEAMPDMAIIFNENQTMSGIINPFKGILHLGNEEDFIGKTIVEIGRMNPVFEEVAVSIDKYVRMTYRTQQIYSFRYEIMIEGKTFHAEAKTVPYGKQVVFFTRDISGRIDAEREISKWKNFLQLIIDHLPIGIFVKNVSDNYRYLYYNDRACDFYDYIPELVIGRNDYEVDNPQADLYREEDNNVLLSRGPLTFERELTDATGRQKFAVMTKTSLFNNDGSRYIIGILVDTTQIRKSELELKNVRNELAIALDAGSLSAWSYDVGKRAFISLYKETVAKSYLKYEDVLKILHPDDQRKYKIFMDDLCLGKTGKKEETFRFFRDGVYEWYETHAIGIRDSQSGNIVQVIGTEKNITHEIEIRKSLEESRFKTDFVIKSNGIIQWDYEVATQMFSSPDKDSFLFHSLSKEEFLTWIHPEDIGLLSDSIDGMVGEGTKLLNIQFRLNTEVGYRWVDIHAVTFKWNEDGSVRQITGLKRDITEWKQVTEELIRLRNKAEESNRLKTAFLANMSHEIRTPLNAIVGFSSLIAQAEVSEEMEEYSRIIEVNNNLLLQLVNDILDLSKIESGQIDMTYSEIGVAELFIDLEQVYRNRVKEGVQLIYDLTDRECVIYSEKNRLTQVISNFLSNSVKFTFEGSIKMGFSYIPGGLRFYVTDTGKGIAEENLPHVFERFRKFDTFVQGTGLGLSICDMIITCLGGKIGVKSELGKGSTFWFTLPCEIKKYTEKKDKDFIA